VKAVGNSRTEQQYTGNDISPGVGMNYYRLKEVDLDGNFTYSPVIVVRMGKKSVEPLIYPNPVEGSINIVAGRETMKEVNVYDVSGRRSAQVINRSALSTVSIPCSNLAQGVYIVEIKTATQRYLKKVIKR
jgi:hypothetical protein